ncbi:MAG: Holliday junction resolvase RecU [Eubacteriales bacterium]|nr:Holliday junction resolvase RecU [Eubacteriales bacterium]
MASFKSHGLRGSDFERRINTTIDYYKEKKLALIQKIPTPIIPVELDYKSGNISLAYFEKKSTVDYIGLVQGIPICFDAKECNNDERFPIQNIHDHQVDFMRSFEEQGGISFLLIMFSKTNEAYYVPLKILEKFILRSKKDNKKSFSKKELDQNYLINCQNKIRIEFLKTLQLDINEH